jgi:Gas vesicle synthesis protein GvpL/GvpF
MMLLYAVVPADAETPQLVGVSGGMLEILRDSGVALVAEECEGPPETSRTMTLSFARVVDELSRSATILPIRFPTVVSDRAAVSSELAKRAGAWRQRLRELDGLVEMVVRASWADDAVTLDAAPPTGSDYLRNRAAVVHVTEQMVTQLERTAGRVCHDIRRLSATRGVRLACLVPRNAEAELRALLDEWRRNECGREATLAGPWPPFSFVDKQESEYP